MEKLKEYQNIILIVLAVLGFVFYWYEYSPYLAKKACYKESVAKSSYFTNHDYQACLHKKGF